MGNPCFQEAVMGSAAPSYGRDEIERRLEEAAVARDVAALVEAWRNAPEEKKARIRRLFNQPRGGAERRE
jgi:hypothetical protein